MKRLIATLFVLTLLPLGGCFMSDTLLVGAEDAAFPYQTIAYKQPNEAAATSMTCEGDRYVMRSADGKDSVDLRFKDLGDGLYLAQMSGEEDGKLSVLYSVLKVDWEKKTAESYKAMAGDSDERPGLRKCQDKMICIDELDAYVALAREAVAAGKPDVTYQIVTAE